MIAPEASIGKALLKTYWASFAGRVGQSCGCDIFARENHRFVRPIIIRPHFRQSHAKLDCERLWRCLKARSGLYSGFLSPPAPRDADGPGQSAINTICCCEGRPTAGLFRCFGQMSVDRERHEQPRLLSPSLHHCPSTAEVCGVIGAKAAPRMGPGFSRVPCCTNTAAASLSSATISEIGTLQVKSVPAKSPSLSQ